MKIPGAMLPPDVAGVGFTGPPPLYDQGWPIPQGLEGWFDAHQTCPVCQALRDALMAGLLPSPDPAEPR